VLRDIVLALLMGVAGILLMVRRRALAGRGLFVTYGVVLYMAIVCLVASALGAVAVILRVTR
jgi:hypothetical protein